MAYHKTTGFFKSSNGNDRIRYYIYEPECEISAIIQISHGMCEYLEIYEEAIDYFCNHGILVCGNDHLGHGGSVASSEDYGYFAKEEGWMCLIRDIKKLNRYIRKEHPDIPCYLLGHSMGSFVARLYTAYYGKSIDGAIYMGTSGTVPGTVAALGIVKACKKQKGDKYRSDFVHKLAFGTYNDRYKEEQDDFSWLCHDEAFRERYITDERHSFIFTLSGFEDILTMLYHISSPKWYKRLPKELPYLLLAGTEDPVGQYGKGVKEVYKRMELEGCHHTTLKLYEGQRHVLFQESVKEDVMEEIVSWIKNKTQGGTVSR